MHIHSPFTNLNKNYNCDVKTYCDKIVEENIKVIGLTNYFHITQQEYDEIYNYLRSKCFVIPNFEFRTNDKNKDNEYINYHILFNPEINLSSIHDCIGRVKINNLANGNTYCTRDNLDRLDYHTVTVSFDDLYSQLTTDFKEINDFIMLGANRGYGGFYPDNKPRNKALAVKLDSKSSIILSKKEDTDFFLNKISGRGDYNLPEKPVLACSDAHTINDIGKQFTWIKADPTWEGLKQIIYEPEQRVRIQDSQPDFKEDRLVISEVKYVSKNNLFTPKTIMLNKNLNVIIGGKSSGKSILLYNIARTLLADRKILKKEYYDENKNERIFTEKYKYDFGNEFDFEVKIASGIAQSINRGDDVPSILSEIKYIPQNYLSKLADPENKKGNELRKLIRELLLEEDIYKNKYQIFLDKVKANDSLRESIINYYFEIQDKISQIKQEILNKGDEEVLNVSIITNSEKIKELKEGAGLSEDAIKEYNIFNTELEKIEIEIKQLRTDFSKINSFNIEAKNIISELIQKKNLMISSLENTYVEEDFKSRYNMFDEISKQIDDIETELLYNDNGLINDGVIKRQVLIKNNRKEELIESIKPFVANEEIKKQIDVLEKLVVADKQKLSEINQTKFQVKANEDALEEETSKLFNLYLDNYNEYGKIISELQSRAYILKEDNLEIKGCPKFNFSKIRKNILEISNGVQHSYSQYNIFDFDKNGVTDYEIEDIISQLKEIFASIVANKYSLKRSDRKSAIKVLLKDYFFDYWEAIYDKDTLDQMSNGKASFVILMLIVGLSKSKAPILIDQPEDNLDNRSITKKLVRYLRDKKIERQIIIVTHNPNIVVNADAENIIVANQKGQNNKETDSPYQFDYINGSIENTHQYNEKEKDLLKSMGIREHIADVVEGGKEAFKKRERKYSF